MLGWMILPLHHDFMLLVYTVYIIVHVSCHATHDGICWMTMKAVSCHTLSAVALVAVLSQTAAFKRNPFTAYANSILLCRHKATL